MSHEICKEFVLLDCNRKSVAARNVLIGATFFGEIHGWGPTAEEIVYSGYVSMLQPKPGSRANAQNWQNIYLRRMRISAVPEDKFEID